MPEGQIGIEARRGLKPPALYGPAAIVAMTVVVLGFAPSYYLKRLFGTPDLDTLRQVHGAVMTAWFVLFFIQARLVAAGRAATHRGLGVIGIFLAIVVVATGTTLGIASARGGVSPVPGLSPLVFLALPIGEMVAFAVLFTAAIACRNRSDWHKRLMLLASLAMLAPAFARFPLGPLAAAGAIGHFALADLVILACIAYDTVKNRRVHPAFAAGFVFVVAVQMGRLAISGTEAWMAFARWLTG